MVFFDNVVFDNVLIKYCPVAIFWLILISKKVDFQIMIKTPNFRKMYVDSLENLWLNS